VEPDGGDAPVVPHLCAPAPNTGEGARSLPDAPVGADINRVGIDRVNLGPGIVGMRFDDIGGTARRADDRGHIAAGTPAGAAIEHAMCADEGAFVVEFDEVGKPAGIVVGSGHILIPRPLPGEAAICRAVNLAVAVGRTGQIDDVAVPRGDADAVDADIRVAGCGGGRQVEVNLLVGAGPDQLEDVGLPRVECQAAEKPVGVVNGQGAYFAAIGVNVDEVKGAIGRAGVAIDTAFRGADIHAGRMALEDCRTVDIRDGKPTAQRSAIGAGGKIISVAQLQDGIHIIRSRGIPAGLHRFAIPDQPGVGHGRPFRGCRRPAEDTAVALDSGKNRRGAGSGQRGDIVDQPAVDAEIDPLQSRGGIRRGRQDDETAEAGQTIDNEIAAAQCALHNCPLGVLPDRNSIPIALADREYR